MNKTISINISGFVFNIEEKAYEQLKVYLDQIRNNFKNEEERDEIMDDIEARIAELFQERMQLTKEVIDQTDIEEIINVLGHPEDFATDEDPDFESKQADSKENDNQTDGVKKRFFRDMDNASVGGVCSGLGHYFELDPIVFRIIFILLFIFFGTGILLYIILLLVIPVAKSTAEKIEMKGRFVNVESIKDHVSNIKQSIDETASKSQLKNTVQVAMDKSIKVGKTTFGIISKVIGVGFMIGGIIAIIFALLLLTSSTSLLPFIGPDRIESIPALIDIVYPGENPSIFIFISLLLAVLIPFIGLIFTGIRLLTNYKRNYKQVVWTLAIVWTVSASTLFFFSMGLASDVKNFKKINTYLPIETTSDVIIVDVMNDDQFSNHIDPYNEFNNTELIKVSDDYIYIGFTQLNVIPTTDSAHFEVKLVERSNGSSDRAAIQKIENITYDIQANDNTLLLPPYIKIPKSDKFRGQFLTIEIFVPMGKSIKFGSNIDRTWCHVQNRMNQRKKYENFEDRYYDDYYYENEYNYYERGHLHNYSGTEWVNSLGIMVRKGTETNNVEQAE